MTTETRPEAGDDLQLDGAPPIPGLRFRRLRDDDWEELARLQADANLADEIPWLPTADNLRVEWMEQEGLDLDSVVLAEVDGRLVAAASTDRGERDGVAVHGVHGWVDPPWRRRGIGRTLLAENMRQAAANADRFASPLPVVLEAWTEGDANPALPLLAANGFRPVRWFFLMRRPFDAPIPSVALPDGLELRPATRDLVPAILAAENEAFRDHWGHREFGDAEVRTALGLPELDLSVWQVAWDGDEIAGVVQAWIWRTENERLGIERGWLERISVRRPWRRRGLARALTAIAMERLRDVGVTEAMLGVDADNPTGALSLYEGLGFSVYQRGMALRRPLVLDDAAAEGEPHG